MIRCSRYNAKSIWFCVSIWNWRRCACRWQIFAIGIINIPMVLSGTSRPIDCCRRGSIAIQNQIFGSKACWILCKTKIINVEIIRFSISSHWNVFRVWRKHFAIECPFCIACCNNLFSIFEVADSVVRCRVSHLKRLRIVCVVVFVIKLN